MFTLSKCLACVGCWDPFMLSWVCLVAMSHTLSYILAWIILITLCLNVKNQAKCCLCKQGPYCPTSPFRECFSLHLRWTRIVLWMTKTIVFSFSLLTHRLDMVDMADSCGYLLVHACFAQNLWTAANSEKLWKIWKIWWNHKLRVCLLHDV